MIVTNADLSSLRLAVLPPGWQPMTPEEAIKTNNATWLARQREKQIYGKPLQGFGFIESADSARGIVNEVMARWRGDTFLLYTRRDDPEGTILTREVPMHFDVVDRVTGDVLATSPEVCGRLLRIPCRDADDGVTTLRLLRSPLLPSLDGVAIMDTNVVGEGIAVTLSMTQAAAAAPYLEGRLELAIESLARAAACDSMGIRQEEDSTPEARKQLLRNCRWIGRTTEHYDPPRLFAAIVAYESKVLR